MNTEKPEPWQKDLQDKLGEISKSLNTLATVQALSILYSPEELRKLARRLEELRQAHAEDIEAMQAESNHLKQEHGEEGSHIDSLVAKFGEERANEICAKRNHAFAKVGLRHQMLRDFEKMNPHIGVLTRFLGKSAP